MVAHPRVPWTWVVSAEQGVKGRAGDHRRMAVSGESSGGTWSGRTMTSQDGVAPPTGMKWAGISRRFTTGRATDI